MSRFKKIIPFALVGALTCSLTSTAHSAGSLSGEIGVKLVIGNGCSVDNGSATGGVNNWGLMDFGTQANLVSSVDATLIGANNTGPVTINCSTGLTSTLSLNGGLYGTSSLRNVSSDGGTTVVPYRLYSDSTRTTEIAINTPVSLISNGTAQNIPIYGRIIPADQSTTSPAAGTYTDTVLATLAW
jgi:spore coat protein U-like protein